MILSVSRRTDIPAYFSDWFFQRMREGEVLVRNPMNPRQVSRILLAPDTLDGIVFWSKNPKPMLKRVLELQPFPYYFQFSLTPYGSEVEGGLPPKEELLETFLQLSAQIGKERVVWRYDPILLNGRYTVEEHVRQFERFAAALAGSTDTCIISFVDDYPKIRKAVAPLGLLPIGLTEMQTLAAALAHIASAHGMRLCTCAEAVDLSAYGIEHAACIDATRLSRLGGCVLRAAKDPHQREACGCAESVDIGQYNTCQNGCRYCYANHSPATVLRQAAAYHPASPLLCSTLTPEDRITTRSIRSLQEQQLHF